MILGDVAIMRAVANKQLVISPFDDKYVRPNSYDVHLGSKLLVPQSTGLIIESDTDTSDLWYEYDLDISPLLLRPGEIALGRTLETFEFNGYTGRLEGVSSLGRIYLSVHETAGYFDYGFLGTGTLEIKNNGFWTIRLRAGMRIGQISIEEVRGPVANPYRGRYAGQIDPTASRDIFP